MLEAHKFNQIFFCPTSQSPHKMTAPPVASKEQRRAMVTAAIAPLPKFTLLDAEIQKSSPNYTIDTIRTLLEADKKNKTSGREYFLILGADSLKEFHKWKEVEELVDLAPPLVGCRSQDQPFPKELPKAVLSAIKKGYTETTIMEISSTEIRSRLQLRLYCGHLLPAKVWEYINQNQLYLDK